MKHSRFGTWLLLSAASLSCALMGQAHASDHLDTPTVQKDPRADIGDLYAWTSSDGHRLNLVMTIVGHSFSDRVDYVFHVESGRRFGHTTRSIDLSCRFPGGSRAACRAGETERAVGDASKEAGLSSDHGRFLVFAGMRDDPFFNNVRGTRDAYAAATRALANGTRVDAAGCPAFSRSVSADILDRWKHTDGGPAKNFLAGWTPMAIVISVDLDLVSKGGPLLAVWGATVGPGGQIDRAARPLTGNALLATLGTEQESNALKERYNRITPSAAGSFVPELEKGVALYDGFDGHCGNALLVRAGTPPQRRYQAIARLLADDRLWVNTHFSRCTALFAVERAALAGDKASMSDCGGRAPSYDAVNVYRSLLIDGSATRADDGEHRDDRPVSDTAFPFLSAAVPVAVGKP